MLVLMLLGGILGGVLAATIACFSGLGILLSLLAYSFGGAATILLIAFGRVQSSR